MNDPNALALAQIAANSIDIFALNNGVGLLIGAVIVKVNGVENYAKRFVFAAIASLLIGWIGGPTVDELVRVEQGWAAASVAWAAFAVIAVPGVWAYFVPSRIARKKCDESTARRIVWLNRIFIIPFNWYIALAWATSRQKVIDNILLKEDINE